MSLRAPAASTPGWGRDTLLGMRSTFAKLATLAIVAGSLGFACAPPPGPQTGTICVVAEDCYPGIDHALLGTVFCEDKFENGYCTHTCETDEDCCKYDEECAAGLAYVCTPLSEDKTKRCWISCEASDLGDADPAAHCLMFAGAGAGCRSSGGGSDNRDICAPP